MKDCVSKLKQLLPATDVNQEMPEVYNWCNTAIILAPMHKNQNVEVPIRCSFFSQIDLVERTIAYIAYLEGLLGRRNNEVRELDGAIETVFTRTFGARSRVAIYKPG